MIITSSTAATAWVTLTTASTNASDCYWHTMCFDSQTAVYNAAQQQALSQMMVQQWLIGFYNNSYVAREQPPPERHEATIKAHEQRKQAHERAKELLLQHLTPEQRETFIKNSWFIVEGGRSKKRYRIHTTHHAGNVTVLKEADEIEAHLCCHCAGELPAHDHHLAQKLMIEVAEDEFRLLANRR